MELIVGIILSFLVLSEATTDYCYFCTNHIACKNNGEINAKCRSKAQMIDMNAHGLKDYIVNKHNEYRNQIASGNLSKYDPAVRMPTMQWDDELASIAAYNVKTCENRGDECHVTERFEYSGQNVFTQGLYIGVPKSKKKLVDEMLDQWFRVYKETDMSYVDSYRWNDKANIAPFMIMVAEKNTRIGCAMLKIKDPANGITINVACNYAVTTADDCPIYVKGTTASGCKTGTNPQYPGLCSIEEEKFIDVNDFE